MFPIYIFSASVYATDLTLSNECLQVHNSLRAEHDLAPLTVAPALSKKAQERATYLANQDVLSYFSTKGENVALSHGPIACGAAVSTWLAGRVSHFNEDDNTQRDRMLDVTAHAIGCGSSTSRTGTTFTVCDYDGNQ